MIVIDANDASLFCFQNFCLEDFGKSNIVIDTIVIIHGDLSPIMVVMFSFIGVTGDEVLSLLLFVTSKKKKKLPRGGGSGGKDVTF